MRSLSISLLALAQIQRQQSSAACVDGFKEALSLVEQIGDSQAAAGCAFNLGRAYEELAGIRDLALAEQYCRRGFDLTAKEDRMGRAVCLNQLGTVEYARFREAKDANRSSEECFSYLWSAEKYHRQALEMLPGYAAQDLAVTHNQLGSIYEDKGEIEGALRHFGESIRYKESLQDRCGAGQTRYNAALALAKARRFADARDWAQSALRDFEAANSADHYVVKTLKLLELIESARRAKSQP
jgi:tetratricopeptide (TPR) repeat protein